MAKKNAYLQRQQIRVDVYRQAEKDTVIQFMTDTLALTLNDPEVMGKDVFGKKRLKKVIEAWGKKYDKYHGALEKGDEADYHQIKLDQHLEAIFGDDMQRFGERYPWLKDLT